MLKSSLFICTIAILLYYLNDITEHPLQDLFTKLSLISTTTTKPFPATTSMSQQQSSNNTNPFLGVPLIPENDPSLTKPKEMAVARAVRQAVFAVEKAEGVGARVRRSIGVPKLRNFTPFLMLDHFSVAPGAGFADHPHFGIETITYILSGEVQHEDFTGSRGSIKTGDLQFMTAGKGIMHAEMPVIQPDGSPNVGMQLWVDLPKDLKRCEPRYRDLRASEIPEDLSDDGKVHIKVISGKTASGVLSQQELSYTPVWYFDVTVKPGGKLVQPIPNRWNAFAYMMKGTATFGDGQKKLTVEQYHNAIFEQQGDTIVAEVDPDATEDARFVVAAGMPLDQGIVQYGPFVTNTNEEIYEVMNNFQEHKNGFERGKDWESEIAKDLV